MAAVAPADFRQQVVGAEDNPAAIGRPALALEPRHRRSTEGGVFGGQFLAFRDVSPRHQIQTFQPGVRIAGVIDGTPIVRILAPENVQVGRHGPGVLVEPLPPQSPPVPLHVLPRDQGVRTLFVTLHNFALANRPAGEHAKAARGS